MISVDSATSLDWNVRDYQRWLDGQSQRSQGAYLFQTPELRFEPAPQDQLFLAPGATLAGAKGSLHVELPTGERVRLSRLDQLSTERADVEKLLQRLHRSAQLAELLFEHLGPKRALLRALVTDLFGTALFAPHAVAELEYQISGLQITRFAASPYEIQRSYWQNMADVRAVWQEADALAAAPQAFVAALQQCHRVALMGREQNVYYQPASPVGRRHACPGRLHEMPVRRWNTPHGVWLGEGLRVAAPPVGGLAFEAFLLESLRRSAITRNTEEADWGQLVVGAGPGDSAPSDWFCPERPLTVAHFAQLQSWLREANASLDDADFESALAGLARFHHGFVRLHPFYCANQSLAMNLVNAVLTSHDRAPLPHLILDQLALRLHHADYTQAFSNAYDIYAIDGAHVAVAYRRLGEQRTQLLAWLGQLAECTSPRAVEERLVQAPKEACALLLLKPV